MKLKYIWLVAGLVGLLGARLPVAAQVFTIQHNFTNTPDGATPGQLTWTNGYLYGVTANGGTNGDGMIYRVNPNGTGFTPVYSFTGAANNGISPNDLLVTSNMIYGTTLLGGTNSLGMIFAVSTNGTGFQPLYSFGAQPDGQFPQAGLVLGGSALYGTAHTGGTNSGGVLFKINLDGTGYTILHWFTNSPDGYSPQSDLVLSGSTLFGTTAFGGTNNGGIVFSIGTNGTGYTILHSFTNSPDGEWVYGGLVLNSGILYGNTDSGGTNSAGTIFAINTNGSGYKILYDFSAIAGNTDGWQPKGTLTCSGGTLYGTTTVGGSGGQGTVFQISTNGTGFAVVKSFTNSPADGSEPVSGVLPVGTGVWGTTYAGGSGGLGILYSLQLTPVIIAPPQSLTVTNGTPATFTVTAKDDTVTNYQWYFNTNTLLAGQTGSTLTFASATNNNAGTYTVVVSDNLGSVTSSPAVLTVVTKPVITAQPQNVTATNGNPASFSVGATGSGTLYYQWYFNTNTLLAGQTGSMLNFTSATNNNAGTYTVVMSNYIGSVTSSPAVLTVVISAVAPTLSQQPQSISVTNGYNASFTNVAAGTAPFFYQWYFNTNTPIAGGTNNVLIVPSVATNQAGYYTVIVSNNVGSVTSSPARLTVISTLPIILVQPQPLTVTNGATANFSVTAAGLNPLRYQWYFNTNTAYINKTNSNLSFTSAIALGGYYSVIITNSLGKATSSPALLTVISSPIITLQPQSVTVTNGNPATFTAGATGAGLLSFQWYFRTNTLIAGATNTTLQLTNCITNLAGFYSMQVTNTYGKATSSYALLTISNRPNLLSFILNPANGSVALAFANLAKSTNRLWASTNLASASAWQAIATNVMATNGLWFFTDPSTAKTNSVRFYRFSNP